MKRFLRVGLILSFCVSLFTTTCFSAWSPTRPADNELKKDVPGWCRANWDAIALGTDPALQITNAKVAAAAGIAYSKLNLTGGIVNADISASAAIADTKLAQIASASKVSGTALTGLASIPSGAGVIPVGNIPVTSILQVIYPVGALYFTTSSTNPATTLGFGTWTAFGAGKTLIGIDASDTSFDTVEETGGAKTKTISEANLPIHNHGAGSLATDSAGSHSHSATVRGGGNVNAFAVGNLDVPAAGSASTNAAGDHTHTISGSTGSTGSGTAMDIMNPYIVVYIWKRTA